MGPPALRNVPDVAARQQGDSKGLPDCDICHPWLKSPRGPGVARERRPGHWRRVSARRRTGRARMSNLKDAVGLCVPYGRSNSQYETEFEPATGTAWGYFNPKGISCYSLGLLKDLYSHDQQLAANRGR